MSRPTIIFTNNYFTGQGIASIVEKLAPGYSVGINSKVEQKGDIREPVIFFELDCLSEPYSVSLERIIKWYPGCSLILVGANIPPESIQAYLDLWIINKEHEQKIIDDIQNFYHRKRISNKTDSGNSDSILSDREIEVLRYVALGYTNKEISEELCISTHTVITHRKNITTKLEIKTIAGLAVYAVLNGIIAADEMKS